MSTKHRVVFLLLLLLVAVVQLVVARQISQNRWKEIERTQLLAVRPLTEKETLQLYLYEQVGYDYKEYSIIKKVIQRESEWNPNAIGDSGLAKNIAQFHEGTFESFCEKSGIDGDYESPYDQIRLMVWAFNNSLEHHWSAWKSLRLKGLI